MFFANHCSARIGLFCSWLRLTRFGTLKASIGKWYDASEHTSEDMEATGIHHTLYVKNLNENVKIPGRHEPRGTLLLYPVKLTLYCAASPQESPIDDFWAVWKTTRRCGSC